MEIEVGEASPLSLLSFSSLPSFLFGDFPALLAFAVNLTLCYFCGPYFPVDAPNAVILA